MIRFLLITIIILLSSCKKNQCNCLCEECGEKCRLQCTEYNCTPGKPCCEECTCDPYKK